MAASRKNVEAILPLTPMQEGILFHALHAPGSGVYVEQFTCVLEGDVDADRFRAAWDTVIGHHDALRTLFTWKKRQEPLQVVRRDVTPEWVVDDWRRETDPDERLREWLDADRRRGFTLERAPLVRFALFRLGENRHRFVWTFHHIVLDGWSMRVVLGRVLDAVEGTHGSPAPSFGSFVRWRRDRDHDEARAFWRRHLDGFDTPTPVDVGGAATPWAEHHETLTRQLSPELSTQVATLARESRVTQSTVFRAAWAIVLSQVNDRADVCFGVTVSGRRPELPDVEHIVGLLINTVPCRLTVPTTETVRGWLAAVHELHLDADAHDTVSLADVQRDASIEGALFESLLVIENQPDPEPRRSIVLSEVEYIESSNFPFAVLVVPGDDTEVHLVHDCDRYSMDDVDVVWRLFRKALEAMSSGADRPAREAVRLPTPDRERVVRAWNPHLAAVETSDRVHDLIARSPSNAIAVRAGDESLSYDELHRRADATRIALTSAGAGPGRRVAIAVDRSPEFIVGLLGILRSGAAYVPIATDGPADRLRFVLEDTAAVAIVATDALDVSVPVVRPATAGIDPTPPVPGSPADAAYVIYTSGSTGRPKGVEVSHRSLVASTAARADVYGRAPERFGLVSPAVFDSSVAGIFWTLTTGGTLVLPAPGAEHDLPALSALFASEAVTHTLMLPALYELLLEHAPDGALDTLDTVIVAGEACPSTVVGAHTARAGHARLFNEYGPTEATVWATVHRVSPDDRPVPIGRPIPGMRAFVVDREGRPVAPRVAGELVLAGIGLANGYVNRADDTARRFVELSTLDDGPTRVYRTGDRARFRHDGTIEFLGRVDRQVKIRGHRIELEEVEAALRAAPGVRDAAVIVADGPRADLVGYVAAATPVDVIEGALDASLPSYMRPSVLVPLDELPRTATGKIDRRALPAPAVATATDGTPPETDTEAALADIWARVLGVDTVGIHDDFFRLGGDSLLSIRIIARAHEAGIRVTPKQFFDHPTVAGLAAVAERDTSPDADVEPVSGALTLHPIQSWFFDAIPSGAERWNQAVWLSAPVVDVDALRGAIGDVIAHHDALRLRFERRHDGWQAEFGSASTPPPLTVVHETDVAAIEASAHASVSLDGGLVRAVLAPAIERLLIVIHHLVVDAVSWSIVVDDLDAAYRARTEGAHATLPARTTSVQRWNDRMRERAHDADVTAHLRAWQGAVGSPLPRDRATAGPSRHRDAVDVHRRLDPTKTNALLREAGVTYRTDINDLLLAALAKTITEWSGLDAATCDVEHHGRDAVDGLDSSRTVGWFTTVAPVVLREAGSIGEAIVGMKEALRGAPPAPSYGWLRWLNADTGPALSAISSPEIAFNYLGQRSADERVAFRWLADAAASARHPDAERPYVLEVNTVVADEALEVRWTFDPAHYDRATVEALADRYVADLAGVVDHCTSSESTATPSDFPLADLGAADLSRLSDLLSDDE